MVNAILGQKQKMSQTFVEDTRVPITLVKAGPCIITQVKSQEKDGYWALQLGLGTKRIKNITKPMQGHLRGVIKDNKAPRFLCEVKIKSKPAQQIGDAISVGDIFKPGDVVSVQATSKGKGFAGVVKRWSFAGGPKTHGQSDRLRAPGSIGQGTTPGRVRKGKKMAGRMGSDTVTVKNLIVVWVDKDKDEIALSGPIPGRPNALVVITKLHSGSLEELVEETPQVQIQEGEEEQEAKEGQVEVGEEAKEEKLNE